MSPFRVRSWPGRGEREETDAHGKRREAKGNVRKQRERERKGRGGERAEPEHP
jgi:hypothetical protein